MDETDILEEPQEDEISNIEYQSKSQMPIMPRHMESFNSMPASNDTLALPVASMAPGMMPDAEVMPGIDLNLDESFSWEMISLGLEEPMPMQEAIDELYVFIIVEAAPSNFLIGRKYTSRQHTSPCQ